MSWVKFPCSDIRYALVADYQIVGVDSSHSFFNRCIYLDDVMCFMGKDEAYKAMHLFGAISEHEGISWQSLKNWVVRASFLHLNILTSSSYKRLLFPFFLVNNKCMVSSSDHENDSRPSQ